MELSLILACHLRRGQREGRQRVFMRIVTWGNNWYLACKFFKPAEGRVLTLKWTINRKWLGSWIRDGGCGKEGNDKHGTNTISFPSPSTNISKYGVNFVVTLELLAARWLKLHLYDSFDPRLWPQVNQLDPWICVNLDAVNLSGTTIQLKQVALGSSHNSLTPSHNARWCQCSKSPPKNIVGGGEFRAHLQEWQEPLN